LAARVIDGKALAAELKERLTTEAEALIHAGARPGLATVMAGYDGAVQAYERRARRLAKELAYNYICEALPKDAKETDIVATVRKLNDDSRITGILILRPLPPGVSEAAVYEALDPLKDIEAQHPVNAGLLALGRPRYVPSTPAACFYMLDSYLAGSGRDPAEFYSRSSVVVVGRSRTVGSPAVSLAFSRNATVVSCDEHAYKAGRLREHTLEADALIVAAGVSGLITGEYVRDGTIAIDVGTNPVENSRTGEIELVGDLDFESVAAKAEAISPVPGGVGTITYVCLLKNVAHAAKLAADLRARGGVSKTETELEERNTAAIIGASI
jgi:methylenetetrahydrofolate dehydrogenase (NADP+) / methenyltetrahydrofolate cyclohydrolase